jgi:hypothetical protein
VTASFRSRLSELQQRFLRAFATRGSAFFLTGGAVLSGWVLGHKICALVGRVEIRDLIDLYCLEQTGLRVEEFITGARRSQKSWKRPLS